MTGLWNYYDRPGELSLTVDYKTGQILYLKKDSTRVYLIQKSGVWTQSNVDIQPRYIGSMGEFYTILMRNIRYPYQARDKKTTGTIYVTFDVDTTGKANNYSIAKNIGDNCGEEVIRVLKTIPNLWTVASKNGEVYKSRFMVPVTFKDYNSENKAKSDHDAQLPLATLLNEVVITMYSIINN